MKFLIYNSTEIGRFRGVPWIEIELCGEYWLVGYAHYDWLDWEEGGFIPPHWINTFFNDPHYEWENA